MYECLGRAYLRTHRCDFRFEIVSPEKLQYFFSQHKRFSEQDKRFVLEILNRNFLLIRQGMIPRHYQIERLLKNWLGLDIRHFAGIR